MVGIVLSDRQNNVACANVEGTVNQTGDVELFQSHFASTLHLGFVFAILRVFQFVGCANATAFELYLCAENPFAGELIIAGNNEAGNADGVAMLFRIAFRPAIETVCTIILECGNHFAIAAYAEFIPSAILYTVL